MLLKKRERQETPLIISWIINSRSFKSCMCSPSRRSIWQKGESSWADRIVVHWDWSAFGTLNKQGTNKRKQFQQLRLPSSRWILFISLRFTHFIYPDLAKNQQESKIRLLKESWRRMKFARNLFYQNSIPSMNFSVDLRWRRALEQMLSQMENTWNMQSGNFASCRQFLKSYRYTQAMANVNGWAD